MKAQRVFYGFQEGPITCAPTFKVKRNLPLAYTNKRSPAWCDRVLWRSLPGHDLKQQAFNSTESVTTSDHKPVFSIFTVPLIPRATAWDNSIGRCSLHLTDLKATGLPAADVNGLADPYIKINGSILASGGYKTAHESKTRNPAWKTCPIIPLFINSKERLRQEFLFIRIKDHDHLKKNDLMASGVLMLEPAISGNPQSFKILLTDLGGLPGGVLEGVMTLTWDAEF